MDPELAALRSRHYTLGYTNSGTTPSPTQEEAQEQAAFDLAWSHHRARSFALGQCRALQDLAGVLEEEEGDSVTPAIQAMWERLSATSPLPLAWSGEGEESRSAQQEEEEEEEGEASLAALSDLVAECMTRWAGASAGPMDPPRLQEG
jgi:hypothetical protein